MKEQIELKIILSVILFVVNRAINRSKYITLKNNLKPTYLHKTFVIIL